VYLGPAARYNFKLTGTLHSERLMNCIQINFSVIDRKNLKYSDIKSEVLKTRLKKHNWYRKSGKVIQEKVKTSVKVFKLI